MAKKKPDPPSASGWSRDIVPWFQQYVERPMEDIATLGGAELVRGGKGGPPLKAIERLAKSVGEDQWRRMVAQFGGVEGAFKWLTGPGKPSKAGKPTPKPAKAPPTPQPSPADVLSQQIANILTPYQQEATSFISNAAANDPFKSMLSQYAPTYAAAMNATEPGVIQSMIGNTTLPNGQQVQGTIPAAMSAAEAGPSASVIGNLLQLLQSEARYGYDVYGNYVYGRGQNPVYNDPGNVATQNLLYGLQNMGVVGGVTGSTLHPGNIASSFGLSGLTSTPGATTPPAQGPGTTTKQGY